MKYFLIFLFVYILFENVSAVPTCRTYIYRRKPAVVYRCTELTSLKKLDKAWTNTTEIEIQDSTINNIAGHTFARFGATLVSLDLHESNIATIENQAFIALTKLEKLILWGNKLRSVSAEWFADLRNLRTLDVSFNQIQEINTYNFPLLSNLENFYFDYNKLTFIDYNMFAYLGNLKKVKFGKNPLSWPYQAHLTWQLENQRVTYTEEWEDWGWMNTGIKDCVESGQGEIPNDNVLDCLVGKLLDFTYETQPMEMRGTVGCNNEAVQLVRCMRPKNSTGNSDNETVRRILQDYVTVLMPMSKSQTPFSNPIKN